MPSAIDFANNFTALLDSGISAGATTITVEAGGGAAAPSFASGSYGYGTLEDSTGTREIVRIDSRSGDDFTVVRAQEGTTATAFAAGTKFSIRLTEQALVDVINQLIGNPDRTIQASMPTLTVDSDSVLLLTPTGSGTVTLPTTSVKQGRRFFIRNLSSGNTITLESSDGTDIASIPGPGGVWVEALIDTPTGAAHWRKTSWEGILEVTGTVALLHADGDMITVNLSSAAVLTLPTAGVRAGQRFKIVNRSTAAANGCRVNASGGAQVSYAPAAVVSPIPIEVMALQDTPTTAAHWLVVQPPRGMLDYDYANVTRSAGGDLQSYTLPADLLYADGSFLEVVFFGDGLDISGNQVTFTWGTSTTGAFTQDAEFITQVFLHRVGASSQRMYLRASSTLGVGGGSIASGTSAGNLTMAAQESAETEDETGTLVIKTSWGSGTVNSRGMRTSLHM